MERGLGRCRNVVGLRHPQSVIEHGLHLQEKVIPLPRADDPLISLKLRLFDAGERIAESLAKNRTDGSAGAEAFKRILKCFGKRAGVIVSVADRLARRLKALCHAKISTD